MREAKIEVIWQLFNYLAGVFPFEGDRQEGYVCLGNCLGFFYHNIFLHSSEMKDNALDTTK